jgi:hypothetical protein
VLERLRRRRATPDDAAVIAQVRSLIAARESHLAQSLAESLRADARAGTLGPLAAGVVAFRRGYLELAREELRHVARRDWARLAPAEYVRSGLALAPEETLREIAELVASDPPGVDAPSWYEILAAVFGHGEQELARAVFAVFERHLPAGSPLCRQRDSIRPWIAADARSPSAARPPDGRRTVAIMDYGHPGADRASANIGDHIQSVAALGHLVRHRGARLHGPHELTGALAELGARTGPELRRGDVVADVQVMTVHRDASMYQPIPEDTWVLCFGWYMHALFEQRHGFPLHRNLRPIFVSFHCNKRGLLTPEAIDYLRRYGPVGCRDWTTVHLLLSCGVPAFFSGCLTTTISTVFPEPASAPPAGAPPAYVDMPPDDLPAGAVAYRHSDPAVRRRTFVANVRNAIELLETYRREHREVVTSRLHCYLPLRSMGVQVEFRPQNRSDVRFDGLIDISDAQFGAIRDGLLAKLEPVHAAILGGRPEADVYALWREITAADVAAAERLRTPAIALPPVSDGMRRRLRRAADATVTAAPPAGAAVHCAVVVQKGDGLAVSVLAASLLERTARPLHFWLLARPGTGAMERRLAERFPQAGFSRVPVRGLGRVVRLVMPDLLPSVDRVILLPLPAVATGDIAELAGLDLGAHAFAAPLKPGTVRVSGFGVIHAAAARLRDRNQAAATLRRTAHARHRFDFDAFTGDVLVLDLARMRRKRLSAAALPLAQELGLGELEALHYLAGPDRATVPGHWAAVPTRTPERGPGLLHWADRVKPWQPELTPERELWRRYAARFRPQPARPAG